MIRRLLLAAAVIPAALILPAAVAGAQEIPNDGSAIAPAATVTLPAFLVLVVASLLIPVATGLLTKLEASVTLKQILTALIATVAGIVTTSTQADGTAIISTTTVQYALLSFAIATVGYLGIYQPHDANAKLAPNFGIGGGAGGTEP